MLPTLLQTTSTQTGTLLGPEPWSPAHVSWRLLTQYQQNLGGGFSQQNSGSCSHQMLQTESG